MISNWRMATLSLRSICCVTFPYTPLTLPPRDRVSLSVLTPPLTPNHPHPPLHTPGPPSSTRVLPPFLNSADVTGAICGATVWII